MMKKISWSALLAGMFTDFGMVVLQVLVIFWIYATTRSTLLLYSWVFVSEILVAVFVGYVIGKVAKEEPFLNALAYYAGMLVLTGAFALLLPEEQWIHVSSFWTISIQALEFSGLCFGALLAKK